MDQTSTKDKSALKESALDPISRTSEILFGLIMVLSFTCTLSAANVGQGEVRDVLLGALGCNLAWGIIDAFFYIMNIVAERGRERLLIQKLKETPQQSDVRELYRDILPEYIIGSLSPASFSEMRTHILQNFSINKFKLLTVADLRAAFVVFALVFLTTFPVSIPFLVMHDLLPAMRVSNGIALLLLFGVGFSLGKYSGLKAWLLGLGMMIVGVILVGITIALGG